jgi:L,D-peptidoglycan transpeptidase YkuD (ErfK/YbiS/YcfS/YnhG family)
MPSCQDEDRRGIHVFCTNGLWILLVTLLFSSGSVIADNSGSVSGTVRESSGPVIQDNAIVARNLDTSVQQTTKTNAKGFYSFAGLPVGRYEIEVRRPGFKTNLITGLVIGPNTESHVDVILWALGTTPSEAPSQNPLDDPKLSGAQKAIVVTTSGWNATGGTLTRYVRSDNRWERISDPIPVVVGESGLGWDPSITSLHPDVFPGPVKHEGDGRSPSGVFQLKATFGYADSLPGSLIYLPLAPTTVCVNDQTSRYYGWIEDPTNFVPPDAAWKSSEQMRRSDDLYRWGIFVSYDIPPPGGSCIFLHIWDGPAKGTVGGTAMASGDMEDIVKWVDGRGRAVLVQLPQPEYDRLKEHWFLP